MYRTCTEMSREECNDNSGLALTDPSGYPRELYCHCANVQHSAQIQIKDVVSSVRHCKLGILLYFHIYFQRSPNHVILPIQLLILETLKWANSLSSKRLLYEHILFWTYSNKTQAFTKSPWSFGQMYHSSYSAI